MPPALGVCLPLEQEHVQLHSAILHALPGFLVPASYISDQANSIGISSASWQACFQCGLAAVGQCVRVDSGSRSDQFSAFRGTTLASLLSGNGANCSFAAGSDASIADARQPSMQSVLCADTTLQIAVVLDGLAFGLLRAAPSPIIDVDDYGSLVWAPGTDASAIYMSLGNQGSAAAVCQVVPQSCCLAGEECGVVAAQPSAPQGLRMQQCGLHVVHLTSGAPAAEELVGGCELAVVCDSGAALYQYIPFWRAAVADLTPPAAAQQPWPASACAVADFLVSLPASLASSASPSQLRAYNLRYARAHIVRGRTGAGHDTPVCALQPLGTGGCGRRRFRQQRCNAPTRRAQRAHSSECQLCSRRRRFGSCSALCASSERKQHVPAAGAAPGLSQCQRGLNQHCRDRHLGGACPAAWSCSNSPGYCPLPTATCSGFLAKSITHFACRLRRLASKVCHVLPMCH